MFSLVVLCLGGGAEELLPKMLGVGFPVLLASVQAVAVRRPVAAGYQNCEKNFFILSRSVMFLYAICSILFAETM